MSRQLDETSGTFLQIDLLSACLCVAVVLFIFAAARITPKFIKRDSEPLREVTFEFTPALPEDFQVFVGASLGKYPGHSTVPIQLHTSGVEASDGIRTLFRSISSKDKQVSLVSFVVSHDDDSWPITFTVTLTQPSLERDESDETVAWICSSSPGPSSLERGEFVLPLRTNAVSTLKLSVTAELTELVVDGNVSKVVVLSNADNSLQAASLPQEQ